MVLSVYGMNKFLLHLQGISNEGQKAAILGAVAGAHHVRLMAEHYGVPVILHSDHCAKKLLPWFDGMLDADEKYFKVWWFRRCSAFFSGIPYFV